MCIDIGFAILFIPRIGNIVRGRVSQSEIWIEIFLRKK